MEIKRSVCNLLQSAFGGDVYNFEQCIGFLASLKITKHIDDQPFLNAFITRSCFSESVLMSLRK